MRRLVACGVPSIASIVSRTAHSLVVLLAVCAVFPLGAPAHAGGPAAGEDPVDHVLVTAGLTWDDVSDAAPTLQCLAQHSGVAALNTTSVSRVSTLADGEAAVRTGYRGGTHPAPPDLLSAQAVGTSITRLPTVTPRSAPDHEARLRAFDAALARALAPHGGCGSAHLPRILLASVGADGGPGARPSLGVLLDTGHPGTLLTSGATHQAGIVVVTDLLPTILASRGITAPAALPGQPVEAQSSLDPIRAAHDRSEAAALVDGATAWALVPWMIPGAVGAIVLLTPLRRRPRLAIAARLAVVLAPLAIPAGLCASVVPWWRTEHPTLALALTTWAGAAVLSALALAGPWRRSALGRSTAVGALVAGVILAEIATGSRLQVGSPLGAQPISGGRYYGLSNHLYGAVLAGTLIATLGLCTLLRTRCARVLLVLAIGAVVATICVLPTMGADFGSMLGTVPTIGLLALLISGVRPKLWHLAALGLGGAAVVMGVAFLDWLRPPEQRSHLGRFIDDILSGQLFAVISRKLAQNISMMIDVWPLLLVLALALALTLAVLWPGPMRAGRLSALFTAQPLVRPALIALAFGTWLGDAVNDTGPVLVAAATGVGLALVLPLLSSEATADDRTGLAAASIG